MSTYEKIWYISDLHLGHENVLRYDNRPFSDIHEMFQAIVYNCNARVGKKDLLICVGDTAFKPEWHNAFAGAVKCSKLLVYGNHDWDCDHRIKFDRSLWTRCTPQVRMRDGKRNVIVSHYPMEVWDSVACPAYHVHGHIHGEMLGERARRFNAFLGLWDWGPVTLDEMIERQMYGIKDLEFNKNCKRERDVL